MNDKMKVLLTTEGTYPFHQGGVSTWCDILINKLEPVEYVVYSVIMNPFVTQKFRLPEGASLYSVPLWGTEEPSEHLSTPFPHIYMMKKQTGEKEIREHFLPLFRELVDEIITEVKNPHRFADTLLNLYLYFQTYEYKSTFKHEIVWEEYKRIILAAAADQTTGFSQPDIYGLVQSLGWLYRFFNIVNTPVPEVHVTHSSAAAFCGIPCVISKKLNKTPFLLTEHGIYLREQYLSLSKRGYSSFLSKFLIRMVHSVTSLNYTFADQISPVCQYNMRWENQFGVSNRRIDVIYNGIDKNVFTEAPPRQPGPPTMVMVARIDPIKDIMTFIRAARIVLNKQPDAKFVVYGSVSVQSYYEECLELKEQLEMGDSFIFAGHATQMTAAYHSGDIIVVSSVSEAFPYSIIEAMMTGKPVVATDVGGIKEALGETGQIVEPRNPEALAEGIMTYLRNPELRIEIGKEARERALNYFTLDRVLELHLKSYIKLASRAIERTPAAASGEAQPIWPEKQQLLAIEKASALAKAGQSREAITQYREALKALPNSVRVPYILTEVANLYNKIGEYDKAMLELARCEAYISTQLTG
ncbi:GT4 family glycosyltransferase PelF [Paenibacillus sp. MMO-177]|uniref:GT4 family glycosyltransferase PelF n=1 Tax=Paenibacillus sp. MMO-177 TaxID=3081289 RepID=UPI003019A031